MFMSVLIPALNEQRFLSRTIDNIFSTVQDPADVEVIVVDQGGNGDIDPRAVVIRPGENVGERRAMNVAAAQAKGEFLLRIDAHCDFEPVNWERALAEVTGPKDITVAVLTAVNYEWQRIPGHWYGLCRLVIVEEDGKKGLEAKWQTPNKERNYRTIEPNMALTGCGFMLRKSFYDEIGGADDDLPKMGAIGEEFAIKAWYHGGKVQTRTDVTIGHIFSVPGSGYDTSGVKVAQQKLYERYGSCYDRLVEQFPGFDTIKLVTTQNRHPAAIREVVVKWWDTRETVDPETQKALRRRVIIRKYVWRADEHPDELALTDQEIQDKYGPQGALWDDAVVYYNKSGRPVEPNGT